MSPIKDQVVVVFTSESTEDLIKNSGSGNWSANIVNLAKADFLLCIHNNKATTSNELQHGQAFFFAKIKGIETVENKRKFIQISEYVLLSNEEKFKDSWRKLTQDSSGKAQQNPIAYKDGLAVFNILDIDPENLVWSNTQALDHFSSQKLPDLIREAREKIAHLAKVNPENVHIKIDF